jgi:predicted enzyme related to lactoylglutathione lyase
MSERNGYEHGVPCWVAAVSHEPERAAGFYAGLFGWETTSSKPADAGSEIFICKLRGRDVAAVVSPAPGAPDPPTAAWGTYVWVQSADAAAAAAADAGGSIVGAPFDSADGGRMAILSDPAGAVFGVWQPGAHRGAELVNEPGAWAMSRLNTRDPEGAKVFYGAIFGWKFDTFEAGEMEVTLWRLPGYVGGEPQQPVPRDVVGVMTPMGDRFPDEATPHWSVDFWVHDVDAAAARAAELGGTVLAAPFDSPVGRTAVLADPLGAMLSVSKVSG